MKPKLLMEYLEKEGVSSFFETNSDFLPFETADFLIAHERKYVEGFFQGEAPYATSNGLLGIEWSASFANSVRFTNSSLYHAIRQSILQPEQICLSPTSGFHHAQPKQGALFCAFSGQVIAAMKIYQELGKKGAFIDLDGHFGNSIEDSRSFVKELDTVIPKYANINIKTTHGEYLEDLKIRLLVLEELILQGKVDYVVFCHGADSHELDDIGRQLTTKEWLDCATIFSNWVDKVQRKLNQQLPISLSLFGGYRKDDYDSVLSLHTASMLKVLEHLSATTINYQPTVKVKEV